MKEAGRITDQKEGSVLPNKISPNYTGIYSESMDWNTQLLGRLERLADLRTRVVIQNGSGVERANTQQMGDALALKKVVDISDIFRTKHTTPEMDVETNFFSGEAKIIIHDQVLVERTSQREKVVNPGKFIAEVDKLAVKGLLSVIQKEKNMQAGMALFADAEFSGQLTTRAIVLLGAYMCFRYAVSDHIVDVFRNENYDMKTWLLVDIPKGFTIILGGGIVSALLGVGVDLIPTLERKGYSTVYQENFVKKLDPSHHLLRAAQARLALVGKSIVTQKQKNT